VSEKARPGSCQKKKMFRLREIKVFSLTARKKWVLGGLVLVLAVLVGTRYGLRLPDIFAHRHQPGREEITRPATSQSFDDRLALRMPVNFGAPVEIPLAKLPPETRGKVQKMAQRSAYFNGVYIVVMKMTNAPGSKSAVEESLYKTFSKNCNDPAPGKVPKINSLRVNGKWDSGAIRFPAVFGNRQGEMTAVVIISGTDDSFWCINAWGTGKAAVLAEKTAREFVFN
jgi:hypothetical protein